MAAQRPQAAQAECSKAHLLCTQVADSCSCTDDAMLAATATATAAPKPQPNSSPRGPATSQGAAAQPDIYFREGGQDARITPVAVLSDAY